jgi:hypothetical protein
LKCKFRETLLFLYKLKSFFSICCTDHLDIPSCA